jgi:hypothetical protein
MIHRRQWSGATEIRALASSSQFWLPVLAGSIRSTFERRGTPLPTGAPLALTNEFLQDPGKKAQCNALARRVGPPEGGPSLKNIRDLLGQFLLPALGSAASTEVIDRIWNPPGPWREADTIFDRLIERRLAGETPQGCYAELGVNRGKRALLHRAISNLAWQVHECRRKLERTMMRSNGRR